MYRMALKFAINGDCYEKKFWAFTKRGLKRKTKKFYKKHENLLTNHTFCGIICM